MRITSICVIAILFSACTKAEQCSRPGPDSSNTPALAQSHPDPAETPGALFSSQVTQSNIDSTICNPKWTEMIRPPRWYTDDLKRQQLACGPYAKPHARLEDYEVDHRVPLALGGAPWWTLNLWPQPIADAKRKDDLEQRVHKLVCARRMSLRDGQDVFIGDWWENPAYSGKSLPAKKPAR